MNNKLVILLHGVHANSAVVAPVVELWRNKLPDTTVIAPDAPFPSDMVPKRRQWFSLSGITNDQRPARVLAARPALDELLTSLLAAHNASDRLTDVVLAGFSQGGTMVLDALASGRWPVAGTLALSPRLSLGSPVQPDPRQKLCLIHGANDTTVPPENSLNAEQLFKAANIDTTCHILPGLGHTISETMAELGEDFIRTCLNLTHSMPAQVSEKV